MSYTESSKYRSSDIFYKSSSSQKSNKNSIDKYFPSGTIGRYTPTEEDELNDTINTMTNYIKTNQEDNKINLDLLERLQLLELKYKEYKKYTLSVEQERNKFEQKYLASEKIVNEQVKLIKRYRRKLNI